MGAGEERSPAKPSKSPSSTQETAPVTPSYADWSNSMQAYYGAGAAPPFFPIASPPPHPYMWGGQHPLMPPYGTPVPYPALYPPPGVYAHPNMATTPGTVQANTDSEVKTAEGKERSSARKSRAIIERNVRENGVTTYLSELLERRCLEQSTHIIKMPFRTEKGAVRKWISRFEVRPYMETFTERRHCRKVQEPYSFTFKES